MTRWVDTQSELDAIVSTLVDEPMFGLDTEFLREKTYYAKLALVQVAWADQVALIDPLAVDVAPLATALRGDALVVMHAGSQDLEIFDRACGAEPARYLDTQVAAAFLGHGQISLVRLVEAVLGQRLSKGDQLADWTQRPLRDEQREYAAGDVAHLLALVRSMKDELGKRWEWALDESRAALAKPRGPQDPDRAWWKLKGARRLRGKTRKVAQAVAAWCEREARRRDLPPRFVLGDLALQSIVGRPPKNDQQLRKVRGLDARRIDREGLLDALERASSMSDDTVQAPPAPPSQHANGAAVALASAWLSQIAKSEGLDPTMLATRADVAELVGKGSGRLTEGWRHQVAGTELHALLRGERVVRFEGGRLSLLPFTGKK